MKKYKDLIIIWTAVLLGFVAVGHAQSLEWDLPGGISFQLPYQSTEVFYGMVKPFKGGLLQQVAGASLPVVTLGRLKGGERLIDGQLGAAGTWPVQSSPVNAYTALGHDFAQDLPALPDAIKTLHLNVCASYFMGQGNWVYGGTLSYGFGG